MNLGLAGRTAIVCGASSGMGLAVAEALRAEGANVTLFARRRDLLDDTAARIGALAVAGDLREPDALAELVERTVSEFGGVDVLVNNGGGPAAGGAREADAGAVEDAVELLLLPTIALTLCCLPHLRRSGRGRVVNIESSSVREPIPGLALSNTVRPAVVGWMKSLAREVASEGVTVNTVAPGWIDTERLRTVVGAAPDASEIPARRLGTPQEVAALVCFLASVQAGYVSGAVIPIDGARSGFLL
ncbi:MAG TPA: SDR family oxidoreductase [Gaiellaceae bacterium]|nr:SDR family oxidoreductase [Gaiellaceae bacterium]